MPTLIFVRLLPGMMGIHMWSIQILSLLLTIQLLRNQGHPPLLFAKVRVLLIPSNVLFPMTRSHATFLAAISTPREPNSFAEAYIDPNWQAAMRAEIEAMETNNTWDIVPGKKAIGCRWVYKIKHNADGSIERLDLSQRVTPKNMESIMKKPLHPQPRWPLFGVCSLLQLFSDGPCIS